MKETEAETITENKDNMLTSYSAENPEHPDWFIYEYQSHRKILVQVDKESGKVQFLREL